jgi:hypothetical protein
MHQTADQDDANAERTGEHTARTPSGGLADAQSTTRSQAALVRESLVRCPGGADPSGQ